jgi:hypothetical protein
LRCLTHVRADAVATLLDRTLLFEGQGSVRGRGTAAGRVSHVTSGRTTPKESKDGRNGRTLTAGNGGAHSQVQTVRGDKGTQEIPVPDVKVVENYADDVKPNYVIPESYVRFTGNSLVSPEFTPYDLDSEDETWLAAYNGDQQRLPADRFERLLYTLEATCSAFVEKRFQVDAAVAAERGAVISLVERQALVASTSTLSKQAALEALRPSGAREVVCDGAWPGVVGCANSMRRSSGSPHY